MPTIDTPKKKWRWTKRIAKGAAGLLALTVVAGTAYEAISRINAKSSYPPPGKLVDVGGRNMHLDCRGAGSPTVVFESGLGSGGSTDWRLVHDRIARFTRACAYDRAGIMWSDAKSTPQDGAAVADDLHVLLNRAGIAGPIVLVGHSVGGPYTTIYTAKYGDQVAGLVLVDPSHPDQVSRMNAAVKADLNPRSQIGIVRAAAKLSWMGVPRLVVALGGGSPKLPARANAETAAYSSHSIDGSLNELDGFDRTLDEARASHNFGNRPLIVLTAMAPYTPTQLKMLGLQPQDGVRLKQLWRGLHSEMAHWSTRGEQRIAPDSGHYIQVDYPDTVVAAVRDMIAAVRADQAAGHAK
ncbi:alpha/beta fold hydrolase [Sphingomonas lycopersici]|uniref:Alpha/beta hydrolase n=1 Tax=Sphingomonas lycopersici TaxID=2951807 RepID=A0AA41ZD66_9SPHN|nr:alpha/beta hydrolase [Sphingomonas lycopersici]MCW6534729.1 alpha/beta hydrolase [Sphingomonas lycopersici]